MGLFIYKYNLRMAVNDSMYLLLNLKYVVILDYIERTVFIIKRNQAIQNKNILFSKRYAISNLTVMENFK